MDGVLHTVNGRPAVRFERRIKHRPAKVWRALTQPEHISQWFPCSMEMELRLNAMIRFVFGGDESTATVGTITELEPERVFAFSWGDDLLRFEVQPQGDGCHLIFTHTFDDSAGAASFASGWQECLAALEHVLDDTPLPQPGDMVALHEAYIDAFGMHAGTASETAEGWQVRFERQLTAPTDVVWTMLTASDIIGNPDLTVGGRVPEACAVAPFPPGHISEVDAPRVLAYSWLDGGKPAGTVRWELASGTGHGARLILTHSGPTALLHLQSTALAAWEDHIKDLARQAVTSSR